jgi:RNA polymerase sigma-70 factor (ECF subfamily)
VGANGKAKKSVQLSLSKSEYRYLGQQEEKEVERAKKDPRAFRPLYDRYYGKIFGFLFKRVSDEAVAADLASQTFLNALLNLKKYEFRGLSFSAWLYRIAANLSTDYFRQTKKSRALYLDSSKTADFLLEMEDTSADEDDVLLRELKLPIAFEALSPKELELVELRFFEEMSFKEIAFVMDIAEGNARTKLHRTLKKMKMFIESNKNESQDIS